MSSRDNNPFKRLSSPVRKRFRPLSQSGSVNCRFCLTTFDNCGTRANHERSCNARQAPASASALVSTNPPRVHDTAPAPPAQPPISNPSSPINSPGSAPAAPDPAVPDGNGGFDISFELCKLMWLANQKRGLPDKDRQTLLDIFNKAEELGLITVPLSYRTLDELKVTTSMNRYNRRKLVITGNLHRGMVKLV
jgi:hypothetical protein